MCSGSSKRVLLHVRLRRENLNSLAASIAFWCFRKHCQVYHLARYFSRYWTPWLWLITFSVDPQLLFASLFWQYFCTPACREKLYRRQQGRNTCRCLREYADVEYVVILLTTQGATVFGRMIEKSLSTLSKRAFMKIGTLISSSRIWSSTGSGTVLTMARFWLRNQSSLLSTRWRTKVNGINRWIIRWTRPKHTRTWRATRSSEASPSHSRRPTALLFRLKLIKEIWSEPSRQSPKGDLKCLTLHDVHVHVPPLQEFRSRSGIKRCLTRDIHRGYPTHCVASGKPMS